jgi:hypothetical protein
MDDPLQFRCACGAEYEPAATCPKCGKLSDPTHFQLAGGSWMDRDSYTAVVMKTVKPENVHICAITNGNNATYTLEDCPPDVREQVLDSLKHHRSFSDRLNEFLAKHLPKEPS